MPEPRSFEELHALAGKTPVTTSTYQYIYDMVVMSAKEGKTSFSLAMKTPFVPIKRQPGVIPPDPYHDLQKWDANYTFRQICLLFPKPTKVSAKYWVLDAEDNKTIISIKERDNEPTVFADKEQLFVSKEYITITVDWTKPE